DLPAIRKLGGFLSYSALKFCSYCNCTYDQIEALDYWTWIIRDSIQVRQQAEQYRTTLTKAGREELATQTGVRWTSLHRLPYYDPVRHLILGFMHNWLEGVLAHQLRTLWGLGRDEKVGENLAKIETEDEQYTETDISESADELAELRAESQEYNSSRSSTLSSESTPTPHNTPPPMDTQENDNTEDEDDPNDFNYNPENEAQSSLFFLTDDEIKAIHECIQNVQLPTWVDRPPINLGEKQHGKLKAHEILILFTVIFPLVFPVLWGKNTSTDKEQKLLDSYYQLTAATNIICSFQTSNSEAEKFTEFYVKYRKSIQILFDFAHSLPNHHFAMHNEALLKYWGPLAGLSEFPGERMNGMFQKVKTNRRIYDMGYTMLKKLLHFIQFTISTKEYQSTDSEHLKGLYNILQPPATSKSSTQLLLNDQECEAFLAKATPLSPQEYVVLLQYLNQIGRPYRAYTNMPHPEYSLVLPPAAKTLKEFTTFSSRIASIIANVLEL
ncbi:hypothetical protein F5878DRAFT_674690, partial [Lentinula raphanica]